jgi:hypothetical protein
MAAPQTVLAQSPETVHAAPLLAPPTHTFTSFAVTLVPGGIDEAVFDTVTSMSMTSPRWSAVGHVVPALGKIGNEPLA